MGFSRKHLERLHEESEYEELMNYLARDVVSFKDLLEKLISLSESLGFFNRIWMKIIGIPEKKYQYIPAINPAAFAEAIFPFFFPFSDYKTMQMEELDPNFIIGGTYNHYGYDPFNEQNIMNRLNEISEEFKKEGRPHLELARYCKIGSFPLYVALEGKNRVSLFRRHGKKINAMINFGNYFQKNEIVILKTKPFGIYYLGFSRESENKPKIILFPFLTVPILIQNGVKISDGGFNLKSIFQLRKAFCDLLSRQMIS